MANLNIGTAFAALSLREAGYSVWANIEGSGTSSELIRDASNLRMMDAGVHVVSWFALVGELMRDWRTPPTGEGIFVLFNHFFPSVSMLARGHRAAVQGGTILPGQETLP